MKTILAAILVSVVVVSFMVVPAAAYPDKPVSFVVPWPPGDLEDILTRMIADEFQSTYGVAAAVINKPSGGGGPFPGSMVVAEGPTDGSMIGSFTSAVPVIGPIIGIEGLTDETFVPIGIFITYPFIIATKADAPYSSLEELAEYAKSNKVVLGHFGFNAVPTKITRAVAKQMGFSYHSEGAFDMLDCNTLASGDADVINTTIQSILPCLDNVKILASLTGKRISLTPDVPTVGEIQPDLKMTLWNGLFVKKGTPQEVIDKITAVAQAAIFGEKAQKLASQTGAELYWIGPKESWDLILSQRATFKRITDMLK